MLSKYFIADVSDVLHTDHIHEVEFYMVVLFDFVDEDGVVRYTLIARSPSGSDNVSFEGMRCETGEYKPYAFGSVDNTWLRASNGEWSLIRKQRANDIRYGLYRYYFCPYGVPQRDAGRAIAALKQGIPLPAGR